MVQDQQLRPRPGSMAVGGVSTLGNDPRHTVALGSSFDIGATTEFDVQIRHVGALPNPAVPAYTAADARVGWKLERGVELSLTARNLGGRHAEWGVAPARAAADRSVLLMVSWRL